MNQELLSRTLPIVFVVSQTAFQANGGVRSITEIIKRLDGFRVLVVTQMDSEIVKEWRASGAETFIWSTFRKRTNKLVYGIGFDKILLLMDVVRFNWRMLILLVRTRCHLVHANDILAFWYSVAAAKILRAKMVFNIRSVRSKQQIYGIKWKLAFSLSDLCIVLSQEMREILIRRLHIPINKQYKMQYIYSIVDPEKLRSAKQASVSDLKVKLGIHSSQFSIGYVGAIKPNKGQLDFIEHALGTLKHAIPGMHVYFLGDIGDKSDYYQACCGALDRLQLRADATFVGFSSDIFQWYRSLDLVVLAFHQEEGLTRSLIESLCMGTYAITFDMPSAKEVIEACGFGRVVPHGDYESLMNAIVEFSQNPGAPLQGELHKLFSPEAVMKRYVTSYRGLLCKK